MQTGLPAGEHKMSTFSACVIDNGQDSIIGSYEFDLADCKNSNTYNKKLTLSWSEGPKSYQN